MLSIKLTCLHTDFGNFRKVNKCKQKAYILLEILNMTIDSLKNEINCFHYNET